MRTADDIIEARCRGASLDDIYKSMKSDVPLDGLEYNEALEAVQKLLLQSVSSISQSADSRDFKSLRELADSLREVASMLEGVCDGARGRTTDR